MPGSSIWARYAVPVLIDASRGDPREVAEKLLGPLASFKVMSVDTTADVAVTANPAPITHLDPPFQEPAPAPRPVAPALPRLAIDNPEPSCVPPPEVDGPHLDQFPSLPDDATFAEILDWQTGGGVPMEHDLLEATGIWMNQQHARNQLNPE